VTGFPAPRQLPPGVKRTTGGSFDPDAPQPYFIASDPLVAEATQYPHVLVAVNELGPQTHRDALERMLDEGRLVMLDSGIFNLAMNHVRAHGGSHDAALRMPPEEIDGFDRLWDEYAAIVERFGDRLWGAVELDQGGAEHKPRTRARIEKELGIVPIPVYHPLLDGWDYYDTLATEYDRLCFGNIVQSSPPMRTRLVHTAMERGRQYPYLWTHLLGMTPSSATFALRMRGSMDSSSWLAPVRWQPSWRSHAMGAISTRFGRALMAHSTTYFKPGEFPTRKGRELTYILPYSFQANNDAVLEDTHQDYSGRVMVPLSPRSPGAT
jgi:hypothetical protein